MKITLARSAGFCFGVKRALDTAFETAKRRENVYMLGDIVHNEDVVRQVERAGITRIARCCKGSNRTLIISAHGAPSRVFENARGKGFTIVDATCPMVQHIHRIAREQEAAGRAIIVIGDIKHTEVHGIIGQLTTKAIVIDARANIPARRINQIKKAAVIVQSTQNIDTVLAIVKHLREMIPDVVFFNTICEPTRTKQKEIKKLPLINDAMLIIGSRRSANTRRLYEISKSLNKKTYWVTNAKTLKKEWFKGVRSLGVTAGASTPESTIQAVIARIKQLA